MKAPPIIVVTAIVAVVAAWYGGSRAPAPVQDKKQKKAPVTVQADVARQADIANEIEATGQVTPVQSVDVRPQISGTIKRVLIKEGQMVSRGAPLFLLEDGAERAALEKARAQRSRDQAQLADAERTLKRNLELQRQNFVSPSAVDAVASNVDSLKAAVAADLAAIHAAEVDLGYKSVSAAIAGRSGGVSVYPGSVVQPNMATPMVSIAQLDPISVSFTVPEQQLPMVFSARQRGDLQVQARIPADPERVFSGKLSFIDNNVDSRSGTLRLKAEFANRDGALWPGMYVTLKLMAGSEREALVIPATAVQTGPGGKFAYLVGADLRVSQQSIQLVALRADLAIVKGLQAGQRVVTAGALNLRPGDQVRLDNGKAPAAKAGPAKAPQ